MSWTKFTCLLAICALMAAPAMADPSASLVGEYDGSQFNWTLSFTPDATLFADYGTGEGTGGALGVSFQIEIPDGELVDGSSAIDLTNFQETIDGTDIITSSVDPYAGTNTDGVIEYGSVSSDSSLGFTGSTVDAIMVSLGSKFFTAAGDYTALTFSTTGDTVGYGGLLAQDGILTIAADYVTVETTPPPAGDFNGDGKVDGDDLSLLLGNWGATVPPTPSGWTGAAPTAPAIDADELSALLGTWGVGVGSLSATSVPEPTSIALVALFGLGLVAARRSR